MVLVALWLAVFCGHDGRLERRCLARGLGHACFCQRDRSVAQLVTNGLAKAQAMEAKLGATHRGLDARDGFWHCTVDATDTRRETDVLSLI